MSAGASSGMAGMYFPALFISHTYMSSLISYVQLNDRKSCDEAFKKNKFYGLLILCFMVLYKKKNNENDKEKKEKEQ